MTKISGIQLFWLFATYEIAMTVLLTISPTVLAARQDTWLSFLIAGLAALVLTYGYIRLSFLYPDQTLVQYSQTILGKWVGKAFILPYFVVWYSVAGNILRETSDFVSIAMFDKTPLVVVAFLMLAVVVYAVYQGGIEGIVRCTEIMGPVIYATAILTIALSMADVHFSFLSPVYVDTRYKAILTGALIPFGFLGESILFTMLLPFVAMPNKAGRSVLAGVGLAALFSFFTATMVIMLYGPTLPSRMWYPILNMARYISFADFIENVDTLVVVGLIVGLFIKLALYLFVTAYGTAQWLGIQNWKRVIWFVAPAMLVFCLIYPNIDKSAIDYPAKFWTPIVIPINLVAMPLLLWIVGVIRKKKAKPA